MNSLAFVINVTDDRQQIWNWEVKMILLVRLMPPIPCVNALPSNCVMVAKVGVLVARQGGKQR